MEYENRNPMRIIAMIAIGAILIVGAIVGWNVIKPYWDLKTTMSQVVEADYVFSLDYQISGTEMLFEELQDGTLQGIKSGNVMRCSVMQEDLEYLEMYVNDQGECIFNVKPAVTAILELIKEHTIFSFDSVVSAMKDIYISAERFQEITGETVAFLGTNATRVVSKEPVYKIKRINAPKEVDFVYQEHKNFFEIIFQDSDITKVIIGISEKEDGKIYLKLTQNDIIFEMHGEYQLKEMEALSMPEENVSDTVVNMLKKIYSVWNTIKNNR